MAARVPSKSSRKKLRCPKCTALFSEPAKAVFECPICACRLLANGDLETPSPLPKDEDSAQIRTVNETMEMESRPTSIIKEGCSSNGNGSSREEDSIGCEQESLDSSTQILTENMQQCTVEVPPVSGSGNSNEQPYVGKAMEGAIEEDGIGPIHSVSKPGDTVGRNERVESEGAKEDWILGSTMHQHLSRDMSNNKPLTTEEERVEEKDRLTNSASSNRRLLQSQMFRTSRSEFSFKYSLRGASLMESRNLPDREQTPASKLASSGIALPDTEKTDVPLRTPLRVRISKSQEDSSDQSEHGRHSFASGETYSDDDDGSGSDFDFPAPWAEGLQDIVLPSSFGQSEGSHFDSKVVVSGAPHTLELKDDDNDIDEAEVSSNIEHAAETRERKSELRDEEPSQGFAQPGLTHEKDNVSLRLPEQEETTSELRPPSIDTHVLDVSNLANCISSCIIGDNLVMAESNEVEESSNYGEEREAGHEENLANMEPSADVQQEALKPYGVVVPDHVDDAYDSHTISKAEDNQTADLQKDGGPLQYHQNLMSSGKPKNDFFSSVNDQRADGLPSRWMEMEQSNGVSSAMVGSPAKGHQALSSPTEHAEMEEDLYRWPLEAYRNGSLTGESSRSALRAEEETGASALSDATLMNASKARLYHERRNHLKSSNVKGNGKSGSRLAGSDDNEDLFMSGQERSLWGPTASQDPPPQAMSEHGDWQRCITGGAEQTIHSALHELEQNPGQYSQYPVNNPFGYARVNQQPYARMNQIYPYHPPTQSLMSSAARQNRTFSHCGYHGMPPTCMLCSYHQHLSMQPQHIGHCGACSNQSGSIAHNIGRVEYWNSHQAHHVSASPNAGSLVDFPQACPSRDQKQSHDFINAEDRSQTSSVRNATQYPPFPKSGAAPYVTCKACSRVLQVPSDLRMSNGTLQKLRCGACGKVTKFSIKYYNQKRGMVSSISSPEMESVEVKNVHYGYDSRRPPINSEIERMESPYKHEMVKGNVGLHRANDTLPQVYGITGTRALEQSSQQRDPLRVQQPTGDTSLISASNQHNQPSIVGMVIGPSFQHASSLGGAMSPRSAAATSYGFERLKPTNPAMPFNFTVDEKDEGLDFGAPRSSDGDSLDQSESRMRSPENHRPGREANQIVEGGVVAEDQPLEQPSHWNDDYTHQDKKPGSPVVLLNREATRFRLNIQPRVARPGSVSAPWSPASDSVLFDKSSNDSPQNREQSKVRFHGSPGQHFVSKGPKYIAGLLRRSLRDFGKGGQ